MHTATARGLCMASSRREPFAPNTKSSPTKQQKSGRRAQVSRTPVTKEWNAAFGRDNKRHRLVQETENYLDPASHIIIYKGNGLRHAGRTAIEASNTLYRVDRDKIVRIKDGFVHPYCYDRWGPASTRGGGEIHDIFSINEAMSVEQINIIIRSDEEGLYMQVVKDIAPGDFLLTFYGKDYPPEHRVTSQFPKGYFNYSQTARKNMVEMQRWMEENFWN